MSTATESKMRRVDDKVMFEIFREGGYDRLYRVVYFTELGDHDKEREIGRAFDGEHLFDGFLDGRRIDDAKAAVRGLLERWNAGEKPDGAEIEAVLGEYLVG